MIPSPPTKTIFNEEGSTLRVAQLRMLGMLRFLDQVCKDNGLTYWLDSGTLLGAARHSGFIPWDDDVDVCMPRKDMLTLAEILKKHPSEDFILQTPYSDSGFFNTGYVLRDLSSEYISNQPFHTRRKYRGLQIDIFPMQDHINYPLSRIGNILHLFLIDKPSRSNLPNWMIRIGDRALRWIIYPLFRLICVTPSNIYRMDYGCGFRTIRKKENVYPIGKIKFEGYEFCAPNNVDEYLKDIYGENWKVIPPLTNIITHNVDIQINF